MSARTDLVHRLAALVGPALLQVEDPQTGWPGLATLYGEGQRVPLALFVGQVGLSHRGRDAVERRFQNPGQDRPLVGVPGRASVLVGLWEDDKFLPVPRPVVVTADAKRREGRATRWSAFAPVSTLAEALTTGWATHVSDSDELIRCIHPTLLPAAITADLAGAEPLEPLVRTAIDASGLLDDDASGNSPHAPAADRARRTASSLVRDARFSRRVLDAYGRRCAMCGLGLSLVQGAHIYPASAPGSVDEPWNGLSLCANHHSAFDRHILAVLPPGMDVVFRSDVLAEAATDPAAASLVDGTLPRLRDAVAGPDPDPAMFAKRYEHYGDRYDWLP